MVEMIGAALWMALRYHEPAPVPSALPSRKPLRKRFKDLGGLGNISGKQRWA
jgi:hypothetical protein